MSAVGLPLSHDSPASVHWSTCRLSIRAVVDWNRDHCPAGYGVTQLFSPAVKGLKKDRGKIIHYNIIIIVILKVKRSFKTVAKRSGIWCSKYTLPLKNATFSPNAEFNPCPSNTHGLRGQEYDKLWRQASDDSLMWTTHKGECIVHRAVETSKCPFNQNYIVHFCLFIGRTLFQLTFNVMLTFSENWLILYIYIYIRLNCY